ncbi:hypothetical protein Bca101_028096 [Brassica carinata]
MSLLLKKDEIALAQDSFALRGYVEAIQLVMIAAVPGLKEEVTPNAPMTVPDSDDDDEDHSKDSDQQASEPSLASRIVLIPAHAKTMDSECKVRGTSSLPAPYEDLYKVVDLGCPDELEDPFVDNLVELVSSDFRFKKKMFKGGLSISDIARLRSRKRKAKVSRVRNGDDSSDYSSGPETMDEEASNTIANMVTSRLKKEISGIVDKVSACVDLQVKNALLGLNLDQRINRLEVSINPVLSLESRVIATVADKMEKMQDAVVSSVCSRLRMPVITVAFTNHRYRQASDDQMDELNISNNENTDQVTSDSVPEDLPSGKGPLTILNQVTI